MENKKKIYNKLIDIKRSGGCGMHIFFEPNILYIHLSKCAGTSIYNLLKTEFKNSEKENTEENIKYVADNFDNFFSFVIVRNIYDKVLSEYNHEKNGGMHDLSLDCWLNAVASKKCIKSKKGRTASFADYNNKYNELDQKEFVVLDEGSSYLSFIGSFENLNEDIKIIKKKLNMKNSLPFLNKTKYNTSKLTKEQIEVVKDRFREDISFFKWRENEE